MSLIGGDRVAIVTGGILINADLPAVGDVRVGVAYGAAGVEYTGTYDAAASSFTPTGSAAPFLSAFGEAVQYTPRGGAARDIRAVVDRNPPAVMDGLALGITPLAIISVANSATTGISTAEIDTGGDTISYAPRLGEAPQARLVVDATRQDDDMIEVVVI